MERDRPFKTIEVIDSRTGKVCKVACMSCIRGHRTTSCGNTVCRTKVLWTCKRPGRPANTCTCPFGPTGRCQCVVAQSACPHKPKKGQKRSIDCRCDEQGRWCCLLAPSHWDALLARQRPRVEFYPNTETLSATQASFASPNGSSTPASSARTLQKIVSLPSTPQPAAFDQNQLNVYKTPPYQVPRFGMMGVGLPMGSEGHQGKDDLAWEGEAPPELQNILPYAEFTSPPLSTPYTNSTLPSNTSTTSPLRMTELSSQDQPFTPGPSLEDINIVSQVPVQTAPVRDNWMDDYLNNYQFPFAICQKCGLNGCTCRNCPPVMQNTRDGSWAQCCSRKHVRLAANAEPAPIQMEPPSLANPTTAVGGVAGLGPDGHIDEFTLDGAQPPRNDWDEFGMIPDGGEIDFNEFMVSNPEPPDRGCCGGGAR